MDIFKTSIIIILSLILFVMYDGKDVGRYVIWDEHELLDTKTGIVYISYTEKYFEDYKDSNDESKYKWFKKEVEFPK